MLTEYSKYVCLDKAKKNNLILEVNYSDDKDVKDCQIIKWSCGDKQGFIESKHLFEFLWIIGTREQQRKSIPQTITRVRVLEKTLEIKATKDIKKEQIIRVPIKINIPTEEEIIGEMKKGRKLTG